MVSFGLLCLQERLRYTLYKYRLMSSSTLRFYYVSKLKYQHEAWVVSIFKCIQETND